MYSSIETETLTNLYHLALIGYMNSNKTEKDTKTISDAKMVLFGIFGEKFQTSNDNSIEPPPNPQQISQITYNPLQTYAA